MARGLAALLLLLALSTQGVYAQAPGLPLVPPPSGSPSFWLYGDLEWARPRLNGEDHPKKYDSTFIPQIQFGWNIADDQALVVDYRYLGADSSKGYLYGDPETELESWRHLRLHTLDIMYRERLGGVGAPLGMDFDMGSRFAYAKFDDLFSTTSSAGTIADQRELSGLLIGPRLGIRPYWMFDQSEWQMTIYGQANASYLLGTFRSREWVNGQTTIYDNSDSSALWNYDLEAGLSFFVPGMGGVLQFTAGYRYEYWNASKMSLITRSDPGTLSLQGPFIRLTFSF
jgi:hypothetical protein